MTATNRIELTRTVAGEPMMSADALALLFGIDAQVISDHMGATIAAGHVQFPATWIKAGKRRSKEAAARTGSNNVFDVLSYWAARDLGAVIEFGGDR